MFSRLRFSDKVYSPLASMLIVGMAIFISEALIMLIVFGSNTRGEVIKIALLDATSQIVIVSPILFLMLFKPIEKHLANEAQYQENLRQEEVRQLALVLDTSLDGFWIVNLDGIIVEVNHAYCKLSGYEKSELIAQTIDFVEFLENGEQINKRISQIVKNGSDRFETKHKTKSGEILDIEISVNYHTDLKERLYCSLRDITQQKMQERAIRSAKRSLEQVFHAVSENSIIAVDTKGVITMFNHGAQKMLGYSAGELINQSTPFLFHDPIEVQQYSDELSQQLGRPITGFETFIARAIEKGTDRKNWTYIRKDNQRLKVALTVTPIKDEFDQVEGYLGLAEDITSRLENESRIAALLSEQKVMLDNDLIGIAKTLNNQLTWTNRAFNQYFGYQYNETIDLPLKFIFDNNPEVDNFINSMNTELLDGRIVKQQTQAIRKNGEAIWIELSGQCLDQNKDEVLWTFIDITDRKNAEFECHRLAFYDPLTDLPNRRLLTERLKGTLSSCSRNNKEGALLFIDLDNFKNLNDTLGHDIGDQFLRLVAIRLVNSIRESDTVARLGGDEFVVMVDNLSTQFSSAVAQAKLIADKIMQSLSATFELPNGIDYRSTPSIGITLFKDTSVTVDELLKQADIAMYCVKREGRNNLRFFDPAMQNELQIRLTLETDLYEALATNQFRLFYQVQIDSFGNLLGVEALIRWIHPLRGLIPPNQFIPVAEEIGMIQAIGSWVIDAACLQLKRWAESTLTDDIVISINVSAKQFHAPDFVDEVRKIVSKHKIEPSLLKIEITESALLNNIDQVIRKIKALNAIGIQFSLDDFGTGYSNLQFLKKLPISQLKIDQSFVRDISHDDSDQAIVRTIISISKFFNVGVIAEGVETLDQKNTLLSLGCDSFQGYLYGKPMPILLLEQNFMNYLSFQSHSTIKVPLVLGQDR